MKKGVLFVILVIGIGVIVPAIYLQYRINAAFDGGVKQANADIKNGIVEYKWNGLPDKIGLEKIKQLKENGVAVSIVDAGDEEIFRYRMGYNSISAPMIKDKYGIDLNVNDVLPNQSPK